MFFFLQISISFIVVLIIDTEQVNRKIIIYTRKLINVSFSTFWLSVLCGSCTIFILFWSIFLSLLDPHGRPRPYIHGCLVSAASWLSILCSPSTVSALPQPVFWSDFCKRPCCRPLPLSQILAVDWSFFTISNADKACCVNKADA